MIKVLEKTFHILETVAVASPRPLQPTVIADELKINRPTCSRILKELCDAGYLMKAGMRSGYTVGPRALTFANTVRYKDRFLERVSPRITDCAEELKQSVLLAERKDQSRYILMHVNRNPSLNIVLKQIAFDDLFFTATGIILLAYASEEDQLDMFDFYKKNGAGFFEEFSDRKTLVRQLAHVREQGVYICEKYQTSQGIAAVPIFRNGCFAAALGVSAPVSEFTGRMREKMISCLKKTAVILSNELTVIESIG